MTDHEKDREAVEWLEWAIARHEEILRITRGGPVAVDLREDVAHEQRILTLAREALVMRKLLEQEFPASEGYGESFDALIEAGLLIEVPADEAFRDEWESDTMWIWRWRR